MTSIALGIFIIGIIYVMVWSIKNDGARSISEQTGFIKMRQPAETPPAMVKDRGRTQHAGREAPQPSQTPPPAEPGAAAQPTAGGTSAAAPRRHRDPGYRR